jgi:hypothetical protein
MVRCPFFLAIDDFSWFNFGFARGYFTHNSLVVEQREGNKILAFTHGKIIANFFVAF